MSEPTVGHYNGAVKLPLYSDGSSHLWFKVPSWRKNDILDNKGDLDVSGDLMTEEIVDTFVNTAGLQNTAFGLYTDGGTNVKLIMRDTTWTMKVGAAAVIPINYVPYPHLHSETWR